MKPISVLFVDDEEDIRYTFRDRFEGRFGIFTAGNGLEALDILGGNESIHVVVTDIRMPDMNGLELIRKARVLDPDIGFIVVSGHADSEDIIEALKVGARSFLRKPYDFSVLEENILTEARRYKIIQEEKKERDRERAIDQFLTSIDKITYKLPNDLVWVNHLSFRLVRNMVSVGLCPEDSMANIALGIIEIITNAIEHGNLAITGNEKIELKSQGENHFFNEIQRRTSMKPYMDRVVHITATIREEKAVIQVEDEGSGFDVNSLLDPTSPENLFTTSGRGILLARTFLDQVTYNAKGNAVTLVLLPK
ncbi:MAG: response regulator [Deltaproteobacteria bacterium]|nr:response regulator [Deltaproteobacteria bacterium]